MSEPLTFAGISVDVKDLGDKTVMIELTGYLDTYNSTDFYRYISREVLEKNYDFFIINLKGLSYASSTGIGSLIQIAKSVKLKDKKLKLFNISKSVKNVMSLLGFYSFFEFCGKEFDGCVDDMKEE